MSVEYNFVIGYGIITDKYEIEYDDFCVMYGRNLCIVDGRAGREIFLGDIFAQLELCDTDTPYVIDDYQLQLMKANKKSVKDLISHYCTESAEPQLMCFVSCN